MHTDKQFLQIFQNCPHWLPPLINEQYASVAFDVDSIVLKTVETELRADIVFTPHDDTDPSVPIIVLEMQMQACPTVFNRTLSEVLRLERLNPARPVVGIVIFGTRALDIHKSPWQDVLTTIYLDQALDEVKKREPEHPMLSLFAPLVVADDKQLEAEAAQHYRRICGMPGISEQQRRELQAVFESWIIHRFDIDIDRLTMILELNPKLKDSAMAKELIAEGMATGKLVGKAELLKELVAKRYGSVAGKVLSAIDAFDEATIREFLDLALDTQAKDVFSEAVLSRATGVLRG